MQHPFTLIHWFGPFSLDEILENSEWGRKTGLYLGIGKTKGSRNDSEILYCGISEQSYASRFKNHHKLPFITREQEIWLGQIISTPYPSNNGAYKAYLKEPERLLTYFMQPELNDKNTILVPRAGTVLNCWFKQNGQPRKKRVSATHNLPDLISWDGNKWRSGNLTIEDNE
ncbi:hypothetical protein [Rodentibacter trehalosifermentans]|uniref:Uncharacterized protein n=1 Tax=Rodentibacter trehalosifermentans TaxID=1908263 RepID=A0A1V3IMW1_9PAST|nr:hypothetical protein [Rodentibacter trehalosifermentans]OOF43376.1 hypothetical protein BKK51_11615 [Rodentibacter trehalosifermentans]OOF50374.1 hypothetical protein BKK53_08105 [Rodentibacter trehalosifermentans]